MDAFLFFFFFTVYQGNRQDWLMRFCLALSFLQRPRYSQIWSMSDIFLFTDTRNQLHCHYGVPNTFFFNQQTLCALFPQRDKARLPARAIGKAEVEGVKYQL
jgi:hypothetical protein